MNLVKALDKKTTVHIVALTSLCNQWQPNTRESKRRFLNSICLNVIRYMVLHIVCLKRNDLRVQFMTLSYLSSTYLMNTTYQFEIISAKHRKPDRKPSICLHRPIFLIIVTDISYYCRNVIFFTPDFLHSQQANKKYFSHH